MDLIEAWKDGGRWVLSPGEEEEGARVLESQEPEVVGGGGRAPAFNIQNRKVPVKSLSTVAGTKMKGLFLLHSGIVPACVWVRQVALVGSAPWPGLPITPRSSLGMEC